MEKSSMGEKSSMLKWVEERLKSRRDLKEKTKKEQTGEHEEALTKQQATKEPEPEPRDGSLVAVPYLPEDCVFSIIIRLPLESLLSTRFTCKAWWQIVNSPDFVNSHLQRSSIGLIYLTPTAKSVSTFMKNIELNVDAKVVGLDSVVARKLPLFQIKYLEIGDFGGISTVKEYDVTCNGHIKATCNGLILVEKVVKKRGLIVMNPATREVERFPFGTISLPGLESYGFGFCHETGVYKLVHLFLDASQCLGCEIMHIGRGPWRGIEGPPRGSMTQLGYLPVFAIGALHWVPSLIRNEHIVSMAMEDEVFVKIRLPTTGGINDRVLEIDGSLGFVSRAFSVAIDVWILKGLGGEGWVKQHTITLCYMRQMVPLFCVATGGELVFEYRAHLYAYDRGTRIMRRVGAKSEWRPWPRCYFPHVNSLISWRK